MKAMELDILYTNLLRATHDKSNMYIIGLDLFLSDWNNKTTAQVVALCKELVHVIERSRPMAVSVFGAECVELFEGVDFVSFEFLV
jgi:hypothetical protein